MRIDGQPLGTSFCKRFMLRRPDGGQLALTLSPLPLGFHERLRDHGIQPPTPPFRLARDADGRPIKDRDGLVVRYLDEHDADYLRQRERYHRRVAVLAVAEALKADPHVHFDNTPSDEVSDWSPVADALWKEFEQAGFTAGDLALLCEEVCRLSNLLSDHVRESQANFSSPQRVPA